MRYFMLEGDLRGRILELLQQREEVYKRRWEFCKSQGADAFVGYGDKLWFLTFPEDQPCPKGWKRLKARNKAVPTTRKLREEMKSNKYRTPGGPEAAAILGIETMFDTIYRTPSVAVFDDRVVVGVDDSIDHIPSARRISDLDYEALVAARCSVGDS